MDGNYQNSNGSYGSGYGWQEESQKPDSAAFGITSLVLGIVSLLLFCTCINWITAILAIIFGIIQLTKSRQRGLAIGGIITAGLSMLLAIALYISIFAGASLTDIYDSYRYDYNYDDNYDYYDGYDYDYDDYLNDYYGGYEEDFGNKYL